jgi:hypothetical protein
MSMTSPFITVCYAWSGASEMPEAARRTRPESVPVPEPALNLFAKNLLDSRAAI